MGALNDPGYLYQLFDTDPDPVLAFLDWLRARYDLGESPTVLDVGCGVGRLLRPMHARGWSVVGMEPDSSYRNQARATAAPAGIEVRPGGFNDIADAAVFDMVLGINGSFAHVLSPSQRADALLRCRRTLRPGGVLVLDLPNLLRVLHQYRKPSSTTVVAEGQVVRLTRRHDVDYAAATFTTHESYTVDSPEGRGPVTEKEHIYAITALPDLKYQIESAGLRDVETFSAITDRAPSQPSGSRIIIAARVT
jgi:SAM-dependent methyltransferase